MKISGVVFDTVVLWSQDVRLITLDPFLMFDDIRPYNDAEVRPVIDRLLHDKEMLVAMCRLAWPKLPTIFDVISLPLIRQYLRWQTRHVNCVNDFQLIIKHYFEMTVERSCTGFTIRGIENIPEDRACLFVSNHRDIALDPAFMGLALQRSDRPTCEIAIGDNLLSKQFVADLMRLNKCFIVNRSAQTRREMITAYQKLSSYINTTILQNNQSIWIAQREGRAKNGDDRTEPAILKMLHMSAKREGVSFVDAMNKLCIVPVSISYQYDPCEAFKAQELLAQKQGHEYVKQPHEDIRSIASGITGAKGDVVLSFSSPLQLVELSTNQFEAIEDCVAKIDAAIITEYELHSSNIYAYKVLYGLYGELPAELPKEIAESFSLIPDGSTAMEQRLAPYSEEVREQVLKMYAAPVLNRLALADLNRKC